MENNNQKLELTWIGKNDEIKVEPRILIHDKDKSYGDQDTENMLIHGDNLLALKALEQQFAGQVKCIYIDPPYNTGNKDDLKRFLYEKAILGIDVLLAAEKIISKYIAVGGRLLSGVLYWGIGAVVYYLYDYAMTLIITFYMERIHNKIK